VYDVRFPTSDFLDGSDAVHTDPDYSGNTFGNMKSSHIDHSSRAQLFTSYSKRAHHWRDMGSPSALVAGMK